MRIAAIDIGTNSVHMIVVRVRPDLSFEMIDREKAMVRLGAGGLDGRALTPEAMSAALQALSKFKRIADSHQVDEILAAATSATREARNGGEFLARLESETGIRPRVISGVEEARLIHQAAVYGVDVGGGRAVVIDIGGGSVEITLGTVSSLQLARSFKIGTIRLTERFVRSDPLSERDERKIVKHVLGEIDRYCEQILAAGFDRVIGTSGTILSIGAVAATAARGAAPAELRNLHVAVKQIRRVRRQVAELDLVPALLTADDKLLPVANHGSYVAVAAPGVDIFVAAPGGGYEFTTGTSVATAHVSGLAALLIARNPGLTPDAVQSILMKTAKDRSGSPRSGPPEDY